MITADDMERRLARRLAVDGAYDRLEEYHVDRRRLVFINNDEQRAGGFGIVRQAHLHASAYLPSWLASRGYRQPQLVAVKQLKISSVSNASDLKRAFTKEVLVWSRLSGHPGIAKFLGFYANFSRLEAWLISPWEPFGNVREFIRGRELEVPERLSLAYDTIDAMVFLHQLKPPVCHGEIKSVCHGHAEVDYFSDSDGDGRKPNVLVNFECRAVLCDFGLARLYDDSAFSTLETSTGFKGSIRWCSPELLNGQRRSPSSDVYSWAWLVWEIMTGEVPYQESVAEYAIMRNIFEGPLSQVRGEYRLSDCVQVWDLMARCWVVEPSQRPTSSICKTTLEYLPHCLPTPKSADAQTRSATLLENLAELESWKGNHKAGLAYLEQALHLYEQEANDKGIASVLRKQAVVAVRDSNYPKARNAASAALEMCRTLNDDTGIADSLHKLGFILFIENNRVDALRDLEESSKMFRAQGDSVHLARCLSALGELYRYQDQAEDASAILQEAVDVASHCGDKLGEASALMILGGTYWGSNHTDQSISTFRRAHDIARSIGWEHGLSACLCRLGTIKLKQGAHSEAEELLRESVGVARRSNAGFKLGQALGQLGRCLRAQARHEEAIPALEESYSVYQNLALSFESDLAGVATLLANSRSAIDDKEGALAWSDRAIAEWRKGGDKLEISRCLAMKGAHLMEMNRYDEGALHLEASLVIDQELQDEGGVRWNRRKLSGIPKTVINREVKRPARLALPKTQSLRNTSLLCDLQMLQRRVPQLTTPSLKSLVKPTKRSEF